MSVLGRWLASRADPVSLEEFGALLAQGLSEQTRAGVPVGVRRALGIAAWYSGVRYLSETIAGLPVHTFRDAGGRRERRADPEWLQRPDVETPRFALFEHDMMSLLHRGNGYAFKLRNDIGQVTGLRPLHPDRVKVGQASDGTKVFQVKVLRDGQPEAVPYTSREIRHIRGLSFDGVVGIDPIRYHAETLGTVAAADEYAGRFFRQGMHSKGYVSLPQKLSRLQADEVKQEWNRFHQGLLKAHEIGVLGGGAEYKTIGLDPQQSQLLESRQWGVLEVARILRIPPHKLYELSRATFSNIKQQSTEADVDSIRPWLVRIEAWTNFDRDLLVEGNFIEFQIEGLLRADVKTRFQAYAIATGSHPWMTPAEVRRIENLPEVEGLDFVPKPLNMGGAVPPGGEE
jgi:HK97 family phage portal protein